MKTQRIVPQFSLLTSLALLLLASLPTSAQETGGVGRIKISAINSDPGPASTKVVKDGGRKNTAGSTRTRNYTTTTGAVSVVAQPGAKVFIKPLNAKEKEFIDKEEIDPSKGSAIFGNLAPGTYSVVAELDGYKDGEAQVTIKPNNIVPINVSLVPELYTVKIKTNVTAGEVRYELNAPGQIPNILPMRGGITTLTGLRAGEYKLDVRPTDVAHETVLALITVGKGQTEFEVTSKRVLCEETFSESWSSLNNWDVPPTWAVSSRKLAVKNTGLALPKTECYKHYADFELESDVKMTNDVATSFVIRARDAKNYYLVQLTGAKADEPYVLRGYVVKDGSKQPFGQSIPIDAFALNMRGKFFTVTLKAKDNALTVSITDSETGDVVPLGSLVDTSKHFAIGAAGLGALTSEQFEVARFVVKPTRGH